MTPRQRTIRSFAWLLGLMILGAVFWWGWAKPRALTVVEGSGKLWSKLSDNRRLNTHPAPPPGKEVRVNGDIGLETPIDLARWTVDVIRDDAKPLRLKMADILALPKSETSTLFFCIEGWSDPLSYAGARFSDFLDRFGLGKDPEGGMYRYVGLATPDGKYYVSLDMESMLHPQTMLAYELNGRPIEVENGAPLRLVIPIKYGIKSLKRVGKIFFSNRRPPDYWAERGYDWFAGL